MGRSAMSLLKGGLSGRASDNPGGREGRDTRFSAVEIRAGTDACEGARSAAGRRILCGQAPGLPLEDCDRPGRCACRYRHFDDRRAGPRRDADDEAGDLLPVAPVGPTAPHPERRTKKGRRADDEPAAPELPDLLEDTYYEYMANKGDAGPSD